METKRTTIPAAEEILGGYFPVLDHGFVALIDYMGSDESIEQAARVSYGFGTRPRSQTRGLVRYLRRHRHTTPGEMVELKFHCAMPMFVARQWVRHRTACLSGNTEIYFDLPGGIERRGNQLYKLTLDEIWRRFQPTSNRTRPDKQGNEFFRRDRLRHMCLRQVDEDTLRIRHTRIVNVFRNGRKPIFRMILADGKKIEATADHRFLFADGWSTLRAKTGLRQSGGRAVWGVGDYFVYVNGMVCERPALYRDRDWLDHEYNVLQPAEKARLVRVERFEYVGEKETYDLEVEGPHHNFVANGIITHNSVNEYSGRYSLMPLLFYAPEYEQFALQSAASRQGREGETAPRDVFERAVREWEETRKAAGDTYGWLVAEDVARELARIDLPLSTYTQWYWKIDLHNLFHFLSLRADPHAQWEIRKYAEVMAGVMKRVAPLSYEAWVDYEFCGEHMSYGELQALRRLLEADDDGLRARTDAGTLDPEDLKALGLSKRERTELIEKLQTAGRPDFELDLSGMKPPEEFEARMREAVPGDFE
jgi:flavin-dependent thymidylate synthase